MPTFYVGFAYLGAMVLGRTTFTGKYCPRNFLFMRTGVYPIILVESYG